MQDGLIRVGGRLKHASMPNHERHPVVLPKQGRVTNLIIDHCHKRTAHQGQGMTQNELRKQGYWILGGSRRVATCIHRCFTCRKTRRSLQEQKMADLPKERVIPSPPFTYTGMDVFGPFAAKIGRKEVKRYGLIFTCYCSRAVHIKMIDDLSTDAFLNGLQCFIALRGTVRQLCSYQGTNFVGTRNSLKEALKAMDINKVQHYLAVNECEFVFNAPGSSHAGGV